jgi:import inner membrane translocase subunit TIM16
MASKLIANLIVMGGGVVLRAISQAYRQAIVNASKTGVAQETVQNMAHKASKTMTEHEARQILGVAESAPWEEVVRKYETLFENNMKAGSFYLQSKVFRAKECLEAAREQQAKAAKGQRQ